MSNPKYSLEPVYKIWYNESGDRIEVGDDSDGLDLIEIKYVDDRNHVGDRIVLNEETASLLIEALQRVLRFREEKQFLKKDE